MQTKSFYRSVVCQIAKNDMIFDCALLKQFFTRSSLHIFFFAGKETVKKLNKFGHFIRDMFMRPSSRNFGLESNLCVSKQILVEC